MTQNLNMSCRTLGLGQEVVNMAEVCTVFVFPSLGPRLVLFHVLSIFCGDLTSLGESKRIVM